MTSSGGDSPAKGANILRGAGSQRRPEDEEPPHDHEGSGDEELGARRDRDPGEVAATGVHDGDAEALTVLTLPDVRVTCAPIPDGPADGRHIRAESHDGSTSASALVTPPDAVRGPLRKFAESVAPAKVLVADVTEAADSRPPGRLRLQVRLALIKTLFLAARNADASALAVVAPRDFARLAHALQFRQRANVGTNPVPLFVLDLADAPTRWRRAAGLFGTFMLDMTHPELEFEMPDFDAPEAD